MDFALIESIESYLEKIAILIDKLLEINYNNRVESTKRGISMTIYEIAAEAGVSASTVSRVINGKPGVKKATKEKVEALLKKYYFSPDMAARGLVAGDTRIVGILVEDLRLLHHTEGAYFIERELAAKGYDSLIFNTGNDDMEKKRCMCSLASRRAEAAVMIGSTFQNEVVEETIKKYLPEMPIVIINGYMRLPNVYGVLADEKAGIKSCVDFLSSKGRRKIAFVTYGKTTSNQQKEEGYIEGIARCKNGQEPLIVNMGEKGSIEESQTATRELIQKDKEVDAIIFATDIVAVAGMSEINRAGMRIPEDIAVIGVDNSRFAELSSPGLTSLDNNLRELSLIGASLLENLMSGKSAPHKSMVFSEIIEREST